MEPINCAQCGIVIGSVIPPTEAQRFGIASILSTFGIDAADLGLDPATIVKAFDVKCTTCRHV